MKIQGMKNFSTDTPRRTAAMAIAREISLVEKYNSQLVEEGISFKGCEKRRTKTYERKRRVHDFGGEHVYIMRGRIEKGMGLDIGTGALCGRNGYKRRRDSGSRRKGRTMPVIVERSSGGRSATTAAHDNGRRAGLGTGGDPW